MATQRFRIGVLLGMAWCATVVATAGQGTMAPNAALLEAARTGDTAGVAAALERGANVNAKGRYDTTPLILAANNGRLDAVTLLLSRGADIDARDTFYKAQAADMAVTNGHMDVATVLLQNGAEANGALAAAVEMNLEPLVKAALAGKVTRDGLQAALSLATSMKRDAFASSIRAALDALPPPAATTTFAVDPATLRNYVGTYREPSSGMTMTVSAQGEQLMLQVQGQPQVRLVPSSPDAFRVIEVNATLTFSGRGGLMESVGLVQGPVAVTLARVTEAAGATPGASDAPPVRTRPSDPRPSQPRNWPGFRGEGAAGNGDGQRAVTEWDVTAGKNVRWKTPIPGIATSSPIIWGTRVFATTAVSTAGDNTIKTGLYGDVKPVDDLSPHEWKIFCLDKATGRIVWERTAATNTPKTKRHTKSTQAGATPVTDGRRVVAMFGSAGLLVAWDMNGKELWRVTLGTLDSGWFFDPSFQWGHASSPIIHRNTVIVQADLQKGSYLAAWDLGTGKPVWRTDRPDEISTWGTPTIARAVDGRDVIVTNGTKVRGYEAATGTLLWTLGPNSEITIGTPVVGPGVVFVTGGYPPVRPIYAIRPGASGDISLQKGQEANQAIVWSNMNEGTYIPTPIVYDGLLFTLNINGVVGAYDAETGKRAFRGRVGSGGAFSASPVAADGHLYLASEDGEVFVVAAASGLTQVAKNDMKEVIMATPAISDGLLVIRTMGHLYGIGR